MPWTQDNTNGYTDEELDEINEAFDRRSNEWIAICLDEGLEPGTDEYDTRYEKFSEGDIPNPDWELKRITNEKGDRE